MISLFINAALLGQLAPLIREFNLGESAITAATNGDMEAFVKALQNKKSEEEGKSSGDKPSEAKKPDDDDDGMALDWSLVKCILGCTNYKGKSFIFQ